MVTMTPYLADVSGRNQSAAPALSAPKGKAVEDVEDIEPKKRETKKAETPVPTAKAALDSVVKAWTDEE
jgi:predicted lipid-binding transport protein (Tim44 family)